MDYKPGRSLLNINPLNLTIGKLSLLIDTSLSLQFGKHYALIGRNGSGKTTLLNYINELSPCDVIYVKQEESNFLGSVLDYLILSNIKLVNEYQRYNELEQLISENPDILIDHGDEYSSLSNVKALYMKELHRANKILIGLGFIDTNKLVQEYSGGWRMRLSLAKALFLTPSLLLLDEPSNHLDLSANIWLSEYLKNYPKTILLVSHDKYLIDETCETIISIENNKLTSHHGNYDKFLDQCQLIYNKSLKDWNLYQKQISVLRKQGKAIDKVRVIEKPKKPYQVKMNFLQPSKINKSLCFTVENVSFGYAEMILENISWNIEYGSRIAIVGNNGVGKSTLFKLLVSDIIPTNGTIIRDDRLKIGYYGQHFQDTLPLDRNPLQYLMDLNSELSPQDAHKYLGMFGLESCHHSTIIELLSGGQKARVKLASFGVIRPHVLLLDEPSNHLDIITVESLITALNNFEGTVILITHNFDFLVRLNCELWVIDNKKLFPYNGSYDNYAQEIYNKCL